MRRAFALGALAVIAVVTLTGCDPLDVPIPSPPVSASASPTPSSSASLISIPLDCRNIVDQETLATTFGDTPLNDPAFGPSGQLTPSKAPDGASLSEQLAAAVQLRCIWADPRADITSLVTTIARVPSELSTEYLDSLSSDGFTCEERYGGQWCQRIEQDTQYPVEVGRTEFARDDLLIEVRQANFPTQGFLENVVGTLWPESVGG